MILNAIAEKLKRKALAGISRANEPDANGLARSLTFRQCFVDDNHDDSLLPVRPFRVFFRHDGFPDRPLDFECRVIPTQAAFGAGRVKTARRVNHF